MTIVRHLRVEHGKLEGTFSKKKILIADSCKALIFELAQIAVSRLKIINTFEYLSLLYALSYKFTSLPVQRTNADKKTTDHGSLSVDHCHAYVCKMNEDLPCL